MRRYSSFAMIVGLACFICFSTKAFALDTLASKTAFQFIDEPVVPRLVGMGQAGTAFDNGGFSFVNPAQPYLAEDQSISLGYAPMPGDLTTPFFEVSWGLQDFFLGVQAANYAINGIVPSTEQGPLNNSFSYGYSLIATDFGYKFGRGAIALTLSGMQERIGTSSRYGYAISGGGLYRLIPGKLNLGLAFLNQGRTTAFTWQEGDVSQQGTIENMPRTGRLGFAYSDTVKHIPLNVACDLVYRDIGYEGRTGKNINTRVTVPVGLEVWPTSYVALRAGKRINFETEVVNFGAGLKFRPLTFDMAFVVSKLQEDIEVKPMFGLTYAIASTPAFKDIAVKKPTPVEQPVIIQADTAKTTPIVLQPVVTDSLKIVKLVAPDSLKSSLPPPVPAAPTVPAQAAPVDPVKMPIPSAPKQSTPNVPEEY